MSCGSCAERRTALVRAGKALGRGDVKAAAAETVDVARSSVQSISSALRQQAAVARQRLTKRR